VSEFIKQGGWPRGINNRANEKRLPEGFLRDSVNVDPAESGVLTLRSGYKTVYQGTDVRGALAVGDYILIADGSNLVMYDAATDTHQTIATIAGAGIFAGTVFNDELFFCTENQCLRFKRGSLRRWGVPTVTAQPVPTVGSGGLSAGTYQMAMTWVNSHGEEGGTVNGISVDVPDGSALQITVPSLPGHTPRLYMTAQNGSTFYRQTSVSGAYLASSVRTDTERLETMHMREPVPSRHVTAVSSVITMVEGAVLWFTDPMQPHLRQPMRGFAQFASDIGFVAAAGNGVYVSADKTYYLRSLAGDDVEQSEVLPYPGVSGTTTSLPAVRGEDFDRVAWMTRHGLAVGDSSGRVSLLSQDNFVPQLADHGSSGIVEHNGSQLVVSTMRSVRGANPMVAGDYYEAEVITP